MLQSIGCDAERNRLTNLLQYQIQQCLSQTDPHCFYVRTDEVIGQIAGLKPAISVLKDDGIRSKVCWVIDLLGEQTLDAEQNDMRSKLYARLAIADYWSLIPSQAELRTYSLPIDSVYQNRRLLHVGEQASPTTAPSIALKVQEPLPLHFLTRTLRGHRTYAATMPPLQVFATTFQREA